MSDFNGQSFLLNPGVDGAYYLQRLIAFYGNGIEPELIGYIKEDKLLDFLLAFGGQTITLPQWELINSIAKDAYMLSMEDAGKAAEASKKLGIKAAEMHRRCECLKASMKPCEEQKDLITDVQ